MGVTLSLYAGKYERQVREINWFGPYGLAPWAQMNYLYYTGKKPKKKETLHYITHTWSDATPKRVDRKLFQRVVLDHAEVVMNIDQSYFFFDAIGYQASIAPNMRRFPMQDHRQIQGQVYLFQRGMIGLPVELFGWLDVGYRQTCTTAYYQNWYTEFIQFADDLQDTSLTLYSSY